MVNAKNQAHKLDTLPEGSVVEQFPAPPGSAASPLPPAIFKDAGGTDHSAGEIGRRLHCLILPRQAWAGFGDRIHQLIPGDISLHAVGQGALGIECVQGKPEVLEAIKVLEHTPTSQRCLAERAFLRELEGGARFPSA